MGLYIPFTHTKNAYTHTHTAYPTTDVPLAELPRTLEWFRVKVRTYIFTPSVVFFLLLSHVSVCVCVDQRLHHGYPTVGLAHQPYPRPHHQPTQLQEQIYPMLATNFQECLPDPTKLRVVDAFVVK